MQWDRLPLFSFPFFYRSEKQLQPPPKKAVALNFTTLSSRNPEFRRHKFFRMLQTNKESVYSSHKCSKQHKVLRSLPKLFVSEAKHNERKGSAAPLDWLRQARFPQSESHSVVVYARGHKNAVQPLSPTKSPGRS